MAGSLLLAVPTWLAFRTGGHTTVFGAENQLLAAIVGFALVGVLAVAGPWPLIARGLPLWALGAFVAFEGWTFASYAWAPLETEAGDDCARAAMYAALFALALAATRSRRVRAAAPWALLAGMVAVAVYALGSRLAPDLIPTRRLPLAGDRLAHPLTYWNALGILMASGVLLAIALASARGAPRAARAAACGAAVPCALALALTLSRGSLVALGVGLIVLGLCSPRSATALAAAVALGGSALAVGAAFALPEVRAVPNAGPEQSAQGWAAAGAAWVLALGTGFAFAALVARRDGPALRLPRGLRAAVVGGLVALIAAGGALSFRYVERTEDVPRTASRVTTLESNRPAYWGVALDAFADHPLRGVGTAGFAAEWRRERDEPQNALDAHSIYVETLAELGVVGFVLLAAFVGVVGLGVARRLHEQLDDPVVPAAAALLAALAFHAGLDWDWEMPAVTLPALILAAATLQPRELAP